MRALVLAIVVALAAPAFAQPRVAVLDTARVFSPAGAAAWRAALARLETEKRTFVAVESPNGVRPVDISTVPPEQRALLEKLLREKNQKAAWQDYERSVLGSIRAAITARIVEYAKAQRIDLLLDRVPLPDGILYASAAVDVTDAFLKYDARRAASR